MSFSFWSAVDSLSVVVVVVVVVYCCFFRGEGVICFFFVFFLFFLGGGGGGEGGGGPPRFGLSIDLIQLCFKGSVSWLLYALRYKFSVDGG